MRTRLSDNILSTRAVEPNRVSREISDLLLFVSYFASLSKEKSLAITFLCVLCKLKLCG